MEDNSHYQSSAIDSSFTTDNVQPPPPTAATPFKTRYTDEEYLIEDEMIPDQSVSLLTCLSPNLKQFLGVGIVKSFYIAAYVLITLSILIGTVRTIVGGFINYHWAIATVQLFVSLVMAGALFFFGILLLRLTVELIISIFTIREKVALLTSQSNA